MTPGRSILTENLPTDTTAVLDAIRAGTREWPENLLMLNRGVDWAVVSGPRHSVIINMETK